MYTHMCVELGHLVKRLVADRAHVVPDAPMLFHVLAECGVAPEILIALGTFQRLLARVQTEVNLLKTVTLRVDISRNLE